MGVFEIEKEDSWEFKDYDGNGTIDRVQSGVNDVQLHSHHQQLIKI